MTTADCKERLRRLLTTYPAGLRATYVRRILRRALHDLVDAVADAWDDPDDLHAFALAVMQWPEDQDSQGEPARLLAVPSCLDCTSGVTPVRHDRGLCAFHRLDDLLRRRSREAAAAADTPPAAPPATSPASP